MKIILASASPRRAELIKKLGYVQAVTIPSGATECTDKTKPEDIVIELAKLKAMSVKATVPVLGADTVVSADGIVLGKPHTEREAFGMFRLLCGRTHSVYTGVCVTDGVKTVCGYEKTLVTFAPYDEKTVSAYIASGKPFDKAGGYGIQDKELAPILIGVEGDYDNVIGLPVGLVDKLLRENFI